MAMLKKSLQKEGAAKPPAARKQARAGKSAAATKPAEKKRKRG